MTSLRQKIKQRPTIEAITNGMRRVHKEELSRRITPSNLLLLQTNGSLSSSGPFEISSESTSSEKIQPPKRYSNSAEWAPLRKGDKTVSKGTGLSAAPPIQKSRDPHVIKQQRPRTVNIVTSPQTDVWWAAVVNQMVQEPKALVTINGAFSARPVNCGEIPSMDEGKVLPKDPTKRLISKAKQSSRPPPKRPPFPPKVDNMSTPAIPPKKPPAHAPVRPRKPPPPPPVAVLKANTLIAGQDSIVADNANVI